MKTTRTISFVSGINVRMLLVAAIALFLSGWPVYAFMVEKYTSGIHSRNGYQEVDLKALGYFMFDSRFGTISDVPQRFRALDGRKVALEGLAVASDDLGHDATSFTLVYNIQCCCFYAAPMVQERVFVTAASGAKLKLADTVRQKVFGTLHVQIKHDDQTGNVIEVYHLDAERVEPVDLNHG